MRHDFKVALGALALTIFTVAQVHADVLEGKVVGIADGDTLTLLVDQPCQPRERCTHGKRTFSVRLAEIDTPERRQPYASTAKKALSDAVYGRTIQLKDTGQRSYNRIVGHVYHNKRWINLDMVRGGYAWAYRKYVKNQQIIHG
jgi:endonuclease YncB( thermonuclease family)